ncbi:MAG: 50S ribosomal protein L6 [bacterium]
MSRFAEKAIDIPKGVEIKFAGDKMVVKGPKGTLERPFHNHVTYKIEGDKIKFMSDSDEKSISALHGMYRATMAWMVDGVTKGFSKELELIGVGYRAALQGKKLSFSLGFSHPVEVDPPAGITFTVAGQNKVTISGIDKEVVGETAAKIRSIRKVEPYKGKGIRYTNEQVRRKAGKAAKAGGAG